MKVRSITLLILSVLIPAFVLAQATYVGTQKCKMCHAGAVTNTYNEWVNTLHARNHLPPDNQTVIPLASFQNGDTVWMGSSYGNAYAVLSTDGQKFYVTLHSGSGTDTARYEIAYVFGQAWKQRYITKIESSMYILPIQWNLKKYNDKSGGEWTTFHPKDWFNSDGTLKNTKSNSFRHSAWDRRCAGCHVTGLKVGLVTTQAGDTFYVAKWVNNSDPKEIHIGCEMCHGPGSEHATTGDPTKIINPEKDLTDPFRQNEVCGQCHNRGTDISGTYGYPWKDGPYVIGDTLDNYFVQKPGLWPDGKTSMKHRQQFPDFKWSKHYDNPYHKLTCFDCHEPHSAKNEHMLRDSLHVENVVNGQPTGEKLSIKVSADDNTLCLSCHAGYGPFAALSRAMIQDPVTNADTIAAVVTKHTHHMYDPENKSGTGGASRCTKCHMAKVAKSAHHYDINSHTFEVISPKKTLDYANTGNGMINSCAASCHNSNVADVNVPTFGITDADFAVWNESSDLALADSLWKYFKAWWPTKVERIASTVSTYKLYQNYPNPFNPSTTIEFAIPKRVNVKLVIYDITGRVVKTLIDGKEYEPGVYKVTWNGKNDYGEYVASGVYLYRLEAGEFTSVKKMVLAR